MRSRRSSEACSPKRWWTALLTVGVEAVGLVAEQLVPPHETPECSSRQHLHSLSTATLLLPVGVLHAPPLHADSYGSSLTGGRAQHGLIGQESPPLSPSLPAAPAAAAGAVFIVFIVVRSVCSETDGCRAKRESSITLTRKEVLVISTKMQMST